MKPFAVGFLALCILTGCTYPTSQVRVNDERPSLAIEGAGSHAMLVVDGMEMGPAARYNGRPGTLLLEPGRHVVTIVENGQTVFSQEVFLTGTQVKTLSVGRSGDSR